MFCAPIMFYLTEAPITFYLTEHLKHVHEVPLMHLQFHLHVLLGVHILDGSFVHLCFLSCPFSTLRNERQYPSFSSFCCLLYYL
uniref:Uncharacterized protein n=1 Tax=Arundo donax TaxID=35708 RepID=A0A0A8ZA66_ARUDO